MKSVWLIGAGQMAADYLKVLQSLDVKTAVVGRSESSAASFEQKTGAHVVRGGVETLLESCANPPSHAIVAVAVKDLAHTTRVLANGGVKSILVEKPAGLNFNEIRELCTLVAGKSKVYVGYNRRFYASVLQAKNMIAEDGGVTSFQFEFTEWSHVVETIPDEKVKANWFLANSTHVIDMAFFLGGDPVELCAFSAGELQWHNGGAIYSGAGVSQTGAPFSYSANWLAPGRWGVEVMTRKRRFIFRPLEKLQVQQIGSVAFSEVPLEGDFDQKFKPGLYLQVEAFLEGSSPSLLSLDEHASRLSFMEKIQNKK